MAKIGLSLGTNLGDRVDNLRRAVDALSSIVTLGPLSSLYQTAPLYVTDQPAYLNMAALAESDLSPQALLEMAKELETRLGRQPSRRYGPRLIDIDLLFVGDQMMETPRLTLPHPRLSERRFVLVPLTEIDPFWLHPQSRRSAAQMLAALPIEPGDVVLYGRLQDVERAEIGPLGHLRTAKSGPYRS